MMNATDNNHFFFRLKSHQKQFDKYVKLLGITTDGEKFVLYHILSRDWNGDIILISIETIKLNGIGYPGFIHVKCKTRSSGSSSFCVSDIEGEGWGTDNISKRKQLVNSDLYEKIPS